MEFREITIPQTSIAVTVLEGMMKETVAILSMGVTNDARTLKTFGPDSINRQYKNMKWTPEDRKDLVIILDQQTTLAWQTDRKSSMKGMIRIAPKPDTTRKLIRKLEKVGNTRSQVQAMLMILMCLPKVSHPMVQMKLKMAVMILKTC